MKNEISYIFRLHAVKRMFQRGIDEYEVMEIIEHGEIIEDYPEDMPYPSRLVLGWSGQRPIHVVAADNHDANEIIVVTVYEPGPDQWNEGFRRRKQ